MSREREAITTVASLRFTSFMPLHLMWSSRGRNTWKHFKEYVTYSVIPCELMESLLFSVSR